MSQPLKIMLVDDHALIRQGCRQVLEDAGFEVIYEAADGEEACLKFHQINPDVLIMDLSMKNGGGLEAITRICARTPHAHILVLTIHDDFHIVTRVINAGALGYLSKAADPDALIAAVKQVALGKSYISNELALPLVLKDLRETDNPLTVLSSREFDIFRLLTDSKSNSEIAESLSISKKSVTNYYLRIKQKLGCLACPRFCVHPVKLM